MKTKYAVFVTMLSMLFATITSALAGGQEDFVSVAVKSPGLLRNLNLAQVTSGQLWVSARSNAIDFSKPYRTFVEADGNGAEDVISRLLAKTIDFEVTNSGEIYGYMQLVDGLGNTLMWGNAQYFKTKGPATHEPFRLDTQHTLLPMPSAIAAVGVAVDHVGNVIPNSERYYVPVTVEGILFPRWLAARPNGMLIVTNDDLSITSYRLGEGFEPRPSTEEYYLPDHYEYLGDSRAIEIVALEAEPTARIMSRGQRMTVNVQGVNNRYPHRPYMKRPAWMILMDDAGNEKQIKLRTDRPTRVFIPKGTFRIRFERVIEVWPDPIGTSDGLGGAPDSN